MRNPESGSLVTRIERLESENRRLRRTFATAVVVIGIPFLLTHCSPKAPDVVKARQFLVEDAGGKMRAAVSFDDAGTRLRLFDTNGIRRASLAVSADGLPGLALFDAEGKPGALLEMTKDGPRIDLNDSKGRTIFSKP